ncbi:hypothetical protein GGR50DRAFT_638713 [Xylaria sp. CBS 124048]|nr:hypothetical protein GGR50DRAFT_638713 [Xylaria sp. CBS 124048]
MPSAAIQNPPVLAETKSSKKKRAKTERTESPAPTASPAPEKAASASGADASDDGNENVYIRELQKNIRNVKKRILGASKTDHIVEQHKDKTLDELVDAKLINADQRAQRLKKPQLEAQLAQFEEQLVQYKKVDEDYKFRSVAEKAVLEKTLTEKFEKEKADAISELTEKAKANYQKSLHDSLLILSQFLRLAAARRSEEADASLDANMALEGVLLNIYSGDEHAVSTMLKLIEGVSEVTTSVAGDELQTTYDQVKDAAVAYINPSPAAEAEAETEVETVPDATEPTLESTPAAEGDPAVARVDLAEVDTTRVVEPLTNGHTEPTPQYGAPTNADVSDGAANAAAGSELDASNMSASIMQEGWVEVPRNPAETDNGLAATPAAASNVQSWADDQPENLPKQAPATTDANDGFHQVHRNRPRGDDREGGRRGRGQGDRRGDHRGGEHRGGEHRGGDHRGGEHRGGEHRGGHRGGRGRGRGRGNMASRSRGRPEES